MPANLAPDPHPRRPRTPLPAGACDCHAHIFGPFDRFPVKTSSYEPALAPFDAYLRMHQAIGCSRGVLVQPAPYGTDNRAMVAALRSGRFPLRGIALIDDHTTDAEIEALHHAGVVGCRIHLSRPDDPTIAKLPALARRIRRFGWHLQFYLYADKLPDIDRVLLALEVPVVLDHFGGLEAGGGLATPGFHCLERLARSGRCWFKLSAPYRASTQAPRYPDVTPLARALVAAAPHRCLWGTDWPHPNSDVMPNDGDLVDLLTDWIPDERQRRQVLVANPSELYGF